jgi:Carbohydrate binding domain
VGAIQQYNYSHDNEGGFLLICSGVANGNLDGIARYNISQNDKARIFQFCGPTTNTKIYNNTVYIGSGLTTSIVYQGAWNGSPVSASFYNNIIYNLGSGGYTFTSGTTNVFDYNTFYGNHPASEPSDAHKSTANPLLVNPGSGGTGITTVDGYKLQAGSPAIGAGLVIGSNGGKDYWGNTVSATCAPDRGAHQYSTGGCSTPTPSPTPSNRVSNPGFESGALSPWTSWNNSVVTGSSHSGTYSMKVGTAAGSGEQTITGLSPNTTYTLTGWTKVSATSVESRIGVKSYGGTEVYQSVTSTTYTQKTIVFTTGATNTSAIIYCYKLTTTGNSYCDDFTLQ